MESFYGGRSGDAFIIVQRFDDIDISKVPFFVSIDFPHSVWKISEQAFGLFHFR